MISPRQAALTLTSLQGSKRRPVGMDDPTEAGLPLRWWICEREHLHRAWWYGYEHDLGPVDELVRRKGVTDDLARPDRLG